MSLGKSGPKDNSKKTGAAAADLDRKRKEALERQAERAKRSPAQQLAKLDAGGYTAEKERTKLARLLMKGKK